MREIAFPVIISLKFSSFLGKLTMESFMQLNVQIVVTHLFRIYPVNHLRLCKCLGQEAMRVKPVASTGTTRVSKRDMQLGRYLIPAGTLIICPFDAVHHNELNWENADSFWPVGALICVA